MQDDGSSERRLYRLDPEGFREVRRGIVFRAAISGGLFIAAVHYFDGRDIFDLVALPVMLALVVYRHIQRESNNWKTFVLELGSNLLVRKISGFTDLEIRPDEVTGILESRGGLTVKTHSRLKTLFVSKRLIDFPHFREGLNIWAPTVNVRRVEPSLRGRASALVSALICITVAWAPLYVMLTRRREFVVPVGVAAFVIFAAGAIYYRRSPNMPTRVRHAVWILPALPLLAIYLRLM